MTDQRCADASAAASEPLAATAVHVENWLLVEVPGTWPRDVGDFLSSGMPGTRAIGAWLEAAPASRLLLVRRPGVAPARRLAFVVRAAESDASVRRIELADLAELDELDLERAGDRVDATLILVCGHGTRDACCALRGNAVHAALAQQYSPEQLWLSSHQAGHRFAANVLVLPQGIQLGRVAPEEALEVVEAARSGLISLAHYRGRTAYAPRVQAADVVARAESGLGRLTDLTFVADDGEIVTLESAGRRFAAAVDEVDGPAVPASCGAAPEPQRVFRARLV